ncbi:GRIP and coiled-coil domain-containing protein PFC0235w-like [Diaphorina citri]|uniref:GRIP and coiled-coil domain-containing protein PFC0235w-like n=1 Tax=Diaphorina citri TaxID=121845 RepID=A0A1S4EE37_DIACI|nr:GRIP and coiled-coil domain-containing protein PFC0235w-like [Diaphorina citri]
MKSSVKSTYNYNILNLTTFNNNSGVRNTGMSKKRKRTNNTLSGEVENSSDKSEHIESDFRNKVSNFSDKFRTNGEKTNATTASQNAALGKVGDKVKTISTIGEKSSASSESDPNTNNISKSGDKKVEKTSDAGVKDGLGTTLFSVGDSIGLGGDLSRFSVDLAKEVKVTNGIKLKEKLNGALQNGINDLGKRAKIRAIGTDFVNDHLALNCDKTAKPEKIKTDRLAISCDNVNPVKELDTLRNGDKERFFFTTSLFSLSHKIDKTKVSQNELSSVNQSNPKEYGEKVDEIIKNRSSAFDESQAEKTNTINSNVNSNVKNTMDDISNLEKYHKKHSSPPNKDKVNVKKITNTINSNVNSNVKNTMDDISNLEKYHKKHSSPPNKDKVNVKKIVSIDQILNRNLDMNSNKIVETEWKIDGTNGRIVEKSPKIIEANVKYVENAKSVESNTKIVERSTNNVKSNMGRSDLKRKIVDEYEFTDDEMGPNENSAKKSTPLCKEKFGLFNGGLRRIERTDTVSLRVVDIIRNGDKETIDDDLAAATNGKVESSKVGTTNGKVEISKCEPDKSSEVVKEMIVDLNKNKCKIDNMNGYVPIESSLVNGSNDIAKNAKQRTQSLQKFRKIFHSKNAVSIVTSSHGANSLSKIDEICNKLTKTSKENHSLNIGKAVKAPLPGNEEVNPKGVDRYNKESIENRNIDLNKFDSDVSSRDDADAKRVIDIIGPNKTAVFENDQSLEIKAKEINANILNNIKIAENVETNSPVLEKEPRDSPAVERSNQDIKKDELKKELKEFEEESDNRPTEHVDTKVANAETVPSDLKKENEGDASNVDTAIDVKKEVEESDGHIEETAEGNVVDATVVKTDVAYV